MDVFEAMGTARAIRYLKPDPVPTELIEKLIWAATRASSPGNSQAWGFVVVTDPEKKARIGGAVSDAVAGVIRDPGPDADRSTRLMLRGAKALAGGLATAPVLILVCARMTYPSPANPDELSVWSDLAGPSALVTAAPAAPAPKVPVDGFRKLGPGAAPLPNEPAAPAADGPSEQVQRLVKLLEAKGAQFQDDLARGLGLDAQALELALGEAVARGHATCDGFGAARGLIVPAGRRVAPVPRHPGCLRALPRCGVRSSRSQARRRRERSRSRQVSASRRPPAGPLALTRRVCLLRQGMEPLTGSRAQGRPKA